MPELTDTALTAIIQEVVADTIDNTLEQFAVLIDRTARYAREKGHDTKNPGAELYWGGYIAGLEASASLARDTKLRL